MPRQDNRTFYLAALNRHGTNARGLHWNSERSQQLRFDILLSFLPKRLEGISLVDAGCGFADLYLYLKERRRLPGHYLGLDSMPEMAEEARQRSGCDIRCCDVLHEALPEADYYLCSGAMNILEPEEGVRFIRRCFAASRRAFVFNILHGSDDSMVYNYMTARELRALGESMGARVKVKTGYLPRDITMAYYR